MLNASGNIQRPVKLPYMFWKDIRPIESSCVIYFFKHKSEDFRSILISPAVLHYNVIFADHIN